MSRKFSDTVTERINSDPEFTKACLVETEQELAEAHAALKTARDGLLLWKMDVSYITAIIGPDDYVEPPFEASKGVSTI
jgi:hypothetical protein